MRGWVSSEIPRPDLLETKSKIMANAESTTERDELKVPSAPHCTPTSTTTMAESTIPAVNPIRSPRKQIAESTSKIEATRRRTVGRYVKSPVGHPFDGQLEGALIVRNEM